MKTLTLHGTALSETKQAYWDCWNDCASIPYEKYNKERNLNFRASAAVSRDEAVEIMAQAVPHGYNSFNADLLKQLPEDSRVTLAREGSVCVYVRTGSDNDMPDADSIRADEFKQTKGEYRIWWD